jgi:hypothetical protein
MVFLAVALLASAASSQGTELVVERILPDVMGPWRVRATKDAVYVLSRRDNSILDFDRTLRLRSRVGRAGREAGEFRRAEDFDVASDGTLWVADSGNQRISGFRADGTHFQSFECSNPTGIVALSDGLLGVVQATAGPLLSIYKRDGSKVGDLTGAIPVSGATKQQTAHFNQPEVQELETGELVLASRLLVPPTVRIAKRDSTMVRELSLPLDPLADLLEQAKTRQATLIREGGFGGRSVINAIDIQPGTGDLWIAMGTSVLFRYSLKERAVSLVRVRDTEGRALGLLDFDFLSEKEVVGVAGAFCVRGLIGG